MVKIGNSPFLYEYCTRSISQKENQKWAFSAHLGSFFQNEGAWQRRQLGVERQADKSLKWDILED